MGQQTSLKTPFPDLVPLSVQLQWEISLLLKRFFDASFQSLKEVLAIELHRRQEFQKCQKAEQFLNYT